jgi:AcrR family transcriptional regulator
MEEIKSDKREDILDVAERLFAEQGFEAVSVREISKAADINIAMVSYYFGSKEKLYEDVINRKLISTELIRNKILEKASPKEALFAFIDFFVDRFMENRQFHNLIFRELALQQRKKMPEFITEKLYRNFSTISEVINKGIEAKEFKSVDADMTVMTIIGIIKTYTTSTPIVCKVLNADEDEIFADKYKIRLKSFIQELMISHLDIQ